MAGSMDNLKRAFADVVSIDAWHDEFSDTCQTADLHADVTFGTARLGGESESQIRFRLSIRRAEVVVVIPETEPVRVDMKSVSRDAPELQAKQTGTVTTTGNAKVSGKVSVAASAKELGGSIEASAEAEAGVAATEETTFSRSVSVMLVNQSKTGDGHYRWVITPELQRVLDGRPWDGAAKPRLKLIDERKNRKKGIAPMVRVEIRCRREDLVISDLEMKDERLWQKLLEKSKFKNNLVAAEALIRNLLATEGLEVGDISDKFAMLTLARVGAEPVAAAR